MKSGFIVPVRLLRTVAYRITDAGRAYLKESASASS